MKQRWMLCVALCSWCVGVANAQATWVEPPKTINTMAPWLRRAESYEPLFRAAGERHGLDPQLLWVVAYLETRFNPMAVSRKGARGMMQFMPATARRYGLHDPHESASAIEAAARYLRALLQRYGQRVDLALAAYNAGENAVDKALQQPLGNGIPPYRETQNYVRRGLQLLARKPAKLGATIVTTSSDSDAPTSNEHAVSKEAKERPSRKRGLARQSVFVQVAADAATNELNSRTRLSLYFSKAAPH